MKNNNYQIVKTLIISGLSVLSTNIFGQTPKADKITMSPNYTRQVFYNMAVGEAGSTLVNNWDIAHNTNLRDNALRLNHMNGLTAYLYPKGDNSAWASFDTTGAYTWPGLYNSVDNMQIGAFNQNANAGNSWDFGWGVYNSGTHTVQGDSLYLILKKSGSGSIISAYKFMPIEQSTNGDFIFKIAELNGNNEYQDTIFQADANSQYFKYYTINDKSRNVREPAKTDWDISFSRYYNPTFNPGSGKIEMYPTMGVESNPNTRVVEIDGKAFSQYSSAEVRDFTRIYYETLSKNYTEIGSDWKTFNSSTNAFDVNSNKLFMVETRDAINDSAYYLLWFTLFAGASSGEIEFNTLKLTNTISASHPEIGTVNLFPNPVKAGMLLVNISAKQVQNITINLVSIDGKIVSTKTVKNSSNSAQFIDTKGLKAGVYLLQVSNGTNQISQKVVIE